MAAAKKIALDWSWVKSTDFDAVYEPAEDTWLLQDALTNDAAWLMQRCPGAIAVEIGCGSGAVLCHLGLVLHNTGLLLATDVNPLALCLTAQTARHNRVRVELCQTDLLEALRPRLHGRVDVLLFNPPYVPTPPEEIVGIGIERAWAGGTRGRQVLDQILPHLGTLLSDRGVFYLIAVEDNDPAEICSILNSQGLHSQVLLRDMSSTMYAFFVRDYIIKCISAQVILRSKARNEQLQVIRSIRC
jgi:release factor glutamine methyltransferase